MKPSRLKDVKDSHKDSDAEVDMDLDSAEEACLDVGAEVGPDAAEEPESEVVCMNLSVDVEAFCAWLEFMWLLSS